MAKNKAITVQKATDTIPHMGGFTLPISFYTSGNIAPEWEAGDRDYFLRTFWKRFGNDMLQGVIATAVAKVQTQNWQLEGPKRLVQMYHRFLRDEADFHRGYDSLVSRGLQDYYTQDNGWFIERFRSSKRDKAGPALGFAHLDSQRVRATGNVDYPWYYEDVEGAYHLMHRSQVIRIVDLPTPATEMWSDERGFCALSRTLSTAMILTMIVAMKREKLADLPPSALAIFNNISRKQFENSLRLKGMEDDMANNMLYRQLLPLFGIDPAHPASVQFLSLREVWEGFSDEEAMNMAAYSFAAGFRMDPREFWPVSQGTLGTGKEAEVQHQKAKGKSHGLIFTHLERGLNANDSLPKNVKFKFAIQDADEEEQRAKIHSMQIGNIEGMQKAGATLTPGEVRYLLVKKYKVIPQELLVPPVEGEEPNLIIADVYMDDVERQAKEYAGWFFGPVVTMDYDGTTYRKAAWDSARKDLPDGPLFIGNFAFDEKDADVIDDAEYKIVSEELQPSTKELILQTLTKEFPCCDSHATQEFPKLIDNLQELGYLSTEEAYASELMPADIVASIATGLKQAGKQGDDLLMAFVREFRHKLGLREYDLGEKAHKGLETINKKIAVLPRPQARQVRRASAELFEIMDNKEGIRRVKNIPQDIWDEAEKLDLQESQLET